MGPHQNNKYANYWGFRKRRQREEGRQLLREIRLRTSHIGRELNIQVHDAHLTKSTYRNSLQDILHIINREKLHIKIKEKIFFFFQRENLKRNLKKRACDLQGNPIILSADFPAEISQAGRLWNYILKVLKEKHTDQEYFIQQSSSSEMR